MSSKQLRQQALDAKLDKIDAQIAEVRAKADQAKAKTKAQYYEHLHTLSERRDAAKQAMAEFAAASESAWVSLSNGVSAAIDDLQLALDRSLEQFQ